jgi:hypothetical protein
MQRERKKKKEYSKDCFVENTVFRMCLKLKLGFTQIPHLTAPYLFAVLYICGTLRRSEFSLNPCRVKMYFCGGGSNCLNIQTFQAQVSTFRKNDLLLLVIRTENKPSTDYARCGGKTNPAPITHDVEVKQASNKYYQNYIYRFITTEMRLRKR